MKIPLISDYIQKRRDAQQEELVVAEAVKSLQNPYFQTLEWAVRKYWLEDEMVAGQVSEETRKFVQKQLIEAGLAIADCENPVMENRRQLVAAVLETARLQVLILPPAPEPDPTGLRGQYGIAGELKARLMDLATASPELREWLQSATDIDLSDYRNVWNVVLFRYWAVLARANVLSSLRTPLGDSNPDVNLDWYSPLLTVQCALAENQYRQCLGLPSNLSDNPSGVPLQHLRLAAFATAALGGEQNPLLAWKAFLAELDARPGSE